MLDSGYRVIDTRGRVLSHTGDQPVKGIRVMAAEGPYAGQILFTIFQSSDGVEGQPILLVQNDGVRFEASAPGVTVVTGKEEAAVTEVAPVPAVEVAASDAVSWTEVKDGCIDQASLHYEAHKRGKNWIATVCSDKTQPGGLARNFWDRASTSWKKLPAGLKVGDVLEVAAEYVSGSGRNNKFRQYYEVAAIEEARVGLTLTKKPN